MKCTCCNDGILKPAYIDDLFPCFTCDQCEGNWIHLEDYLRWLAKCGKCSVSIPKDKVVVDEAKQALLCPETGALMVKYRISKDSSHRIDLSPRANGIWLDKGEWALLKQEGLALSLNQIFSDPWQREIRLSSSQDMIEEIYRQKFEDNYDELKRIKSWLHQQDNRAEMIAFIITKNT